MFWSITIHFTISFSVRVGVAAVRQMLLATLPRLNILNQSEIRPRERGDAEKYYVKQCAVEYDERLAATRVAGVLLHSLLVNSVLVVNL